MNRTHGRSTMIVAAALFASGAAGCGFWKGKGDGRIVLSGNIELTQVQIAFKQPGRLAELPFREGAAVARGAVVARLDSAQLERQRARDQAGLGLAETLLAQQRTAVDYQRAALAAETEVRRAALQQAEVRLAQLVAGSRKQEIEQARAALEEARTQHGLARQDWERAQTLFKNDDISVAQRDQFQTRFDAGSAAVRQAEQRLALIVEGPRREEVDQARAAVAQARAALRLAEASHIELRRREQEIESRRAQIEQARAQLGITQAQLDDTIVASPVDGIVLVKTAEPGEIVAAGTTVLTIGEIARPWLRGYINEKDLGHVRIGQMVKVTTDSFPGKTYEGRVAFIASEAEFTPKQIQTTEERAKLVYRVKIEVDNPGHELKLNMPADADIDVTKERE